MNRVMRSTVVLAAALGAISCKGDPTDSLRNGIDHLVATPSALYVDNGATQSVLIEAVDDQGNRLSGNFQLTAGSFGPGIDVAPDDNFNLVYNENGVLAPPKNWTRAKFDVTALEYVADSFQVTVGGKSLYVRVRVNPVNLASTIANPTPAIGAIVTLAAPAGLVFDPATTTVSFTPGGNAVITSISTTSVSFIPIPGSAGVATVTNVSPTYSPLGPFTLQTVDRLTVPAIINFTPTYSTATPAIGDTVVMSAAGFLFLPSATVSVNGKVAELISISTDSTTISYIPIPGSGTGAPVVTDMVVSTLTAVPLTVPASIDLVVSAGLTGTNSFGTAPTVDIPGPGQTVLLRDAGTYASDPTCTGDLGGPCRIYKLVLAAPADISMSLTWQGTTDMGVYLYDGTASFDGTLVCDSKGAGTGGQPETCSAVIPAGTWYFVLDSFAPFYTPPNNVNPTDFRWVLTGN